MRNRTTLLLLSLLQLSAWSAPNFTERATGTTFTASNFVTLYPSNNGPMLAAIDLIAAALCCTRHPASTEKPRLMLECSGGQIQYTAPAWLDGALRATEFEINSRLLARDQGFEQLGSRRATSCAGPSSPNMNLIQFPFNIKVKLTLK